MAMTPKVGDKVTLESQFPRDEMFRDDDSIIFTRTGKIDKINGNEVTIEYPPIVANEVNPGAIQKCNRNDLISSGNGEWKVVVQVQIPEA